MNTKTPISDERVKMIEKKNCWSNMKSFVDYLKYYIVPNRCLLCGKWKLFGKMPHKKCEDYELGRNEADEYAKYRDEQI